MLFNNNIGALLRWTEIESLSYSTVNKYQIDAEEMTAKVVFNYDNGGSINSAFCSSAYTTASNDILINYSLSGEGLAFATIVVIGQNQEKLFEMLVPKRPTDIVGCRSVYLVQELRLDDIQFDSD